MPKVTSPRQERRRNPLEADILATGLLRQKATKRKRNESEDDNGAGFVEATQSKKILQLGRELVEEDEAEKLASQKSHDPFVFGSRFDQGDADEDDNILGEEDQWEDEEDGEVEEIEVDDLETFNKFLPNEQDEHPLLKHGWDGAGKSQEAAAPGINLADVILAKIAEYEYEKRPEGRAPDDEVVFPPKVVEVYTKIGMLCRRYKSGKLPKPLKILPTIPGWEDLLQYLEPDLWTPNACFEVTKIFTSSKPSISQRWLELVILDRVRDDIRENKKLNVHLWNALKKALYKPSAFFKGFLFPLVDSGSCTLREAHIITGVLVRTSVPVLHSAAAIKGLCDISAQQALAGTEGGHATIVFIQALLEKRYALPYQVVDSLVFYFLRYRAIDPTVEEGRAAAVGASAAHQALPLIFHKCFLAFAQRYRNDITEDQREALLDLLLTHGHSGIGPEIRRELLSGRGRGVAIESEGPTFDGDDTMVIDS